MPIASPSDSERALPVTDAQALRTVAVRPVRTAAFWAAVCIPATYPALMYGGLNGHELSLLVGLLAVNALALVVGKDHHPDAA